ncbi:hypothetical protein F4780DRAFT_796945, partial [Xylariomycetidae sp. FL0641]
QGSNRTTARPSSPSPVPAAPRTPARRRAYSSAAQRLSSARSSPCIRLYPPSGTIVSAAAAKAAAAAPACPSTRTPNWRGEGTATPGAGRPWSSAQTRSAQRRRRSSRCSCAASTVMRKPGALVEGQSGSRKSNPAPERESGFRMPHSCCVNSTATSMAPSARPGSAWPASCRITWKYRSPSQRYSASVGSRQGRMLGGGAVLVIFA